MKSSLALVSSNPQDLARMQLLATNMDSNLEAFQTVDQAAEDEKKLQRCDLLFLAGSDAKTDAELAGRVQVAKYAAPDCWIVVVAEKKLKTESAQFLKKSGAQVVFLEPEFLDSSKPEFVCSQKLHGEWIPIKTAELKVGTTIPMALFHFMPLNKKFLPFMTPGSVMDEGRFQKAAKVGEVYFKRDDVILFHEYSKSVEDKSAAGLLSRCRRQYLTMNLVYKDLVLLLTDQSEGSSFDKGQALLKRCQELASDFMSTLASVGEAWQVVNNAGFDDLSPVDRAPAIGATAGLMSLLSGLGNATDIFLSALLADVGLLDLHPRVLPLWKTGRIGELAGDDLAAYRNHPVASINRILTRKIPLSQGIKDIIMGSHERVDQKGFPNAPVPDKLHKEAFLIQLAEVMDQELKVDFGRERRDPNQVRKEIIQREIDSGKIFPLDFLFQMQKSLF